jgi:hypothetical protein
MQVLALSALWLAAAALWMGAAVADICDGWRRSWRSGRQKRRRGTVLFLAWQAACQKMSQQEIELRVVERKKAELLAKYSTPGLQKQQQEAIDFLKGN